MQVKAEYEEVQEFATIASKLTKKHPDVFFGLDVDRVKCVGVTNKNRSERKKLWEVKSVPMPIRMDCPYSYYIIIYMNDWVEMEDKHKYLLIADALLTIPTEEEKDGKLNAFDLKDFDIMVRTFGVDYLVKDEVPDILTDKISWEHPR
jgi:hypothetical protein